MENEESAERAALSPEEKKRQLYDRQKELLEIFLSRGAISEAQYEKSLGDLTVKMGYSPNTKQ